MSYGHFSKEFFRTCNVLPFSCSHLALSIDKANIPKVDTKERVGSNSLHFPTRNGFWKEPKVSFKNAKLIWRLYTILDHF